MRLQRALARAGVASRRGAEELITAGRVLVNGHVAEIGASADPEVDVITVGGRRLRTVAHVWMALHKPVGYVVSRRDDKGRPTVFDLVPAVAGLTYVGRLDIATEGLLLFTNDGDGAHCLAHPRFAVERSYRAVVRGRPTDEIREALHRKIVIDDREVKLVRHQIKGLRNGACEMMLVLVEGRNRIVRRICEQLQVTVDQLTRLSHGPVRLGDLQEGRWRYLKKSETRLIGEHLTASLGT